ncbi:MAG TPA: ABC transporter ATP-binding protein [Firmicutes bacterium]|jgi:ABC-2 type transport system ATP-binding protein|nr:ABC transporter ATP-binding protein [Bacillota bacterium]HHT43685.1 ABC transporter ATP-binding protein [Bacillota bacterium]
MLKLEGVSKRYKGASVLAVDNLNLEVRPGEIFGFLGPNGAGKTTTIKMVVGLLTPDQGKLEVNGHDLARDPLAAKHSIGYVPDKPDLYPRLTGLEYLNLIGDVYGVDGATRKQRLDHYLEMFELTAALGDLIQSYSRGMQQKLALTGALLHQPPLFILDEPMVGLDPRSSHLFKNIMRDHVNQGNTVFFSTHVLEVAEQLCHRVGIINKGQLIACGTMDELRQASGQVGSNLEKLFLELTDAGGYDEE